MSALCVKTSLHALETLGVFMLHGDQHSACLQIASLTKLLVGSSVLLLLWDLLCDYEQLILTSSLRKLGEKLHLHSCSSQNLGHACPPVLQLGNVIARASLLGMPREAEGFPGFPGLI